jgi:hypothetical protein
MLEDGDWDAAFGLADELPLEPQTAVSGHVWGAIFLARAAYDREDPELAQSWLARISPEVAASTDIQLHNLDAWRRSIVALGERRLADAIPLLVEYNEGLVEQGMFGLSEPLLEDAATAAIDLGDPSAALPVLAVLDGFEPGQLTRHLQVSRARIHANVAAAEGQHDKAAEQYALALATARNLNKAATISHVLVDYGRWLVQTDRAEEAAPLLDEARTTFERMKATRWLERLDEISPRAEAVVT